MEIESILVFIFGRTFNDETYHLISLPFFCTDAQEPFYLTFYAQDFCNLHSIQFVGKHCFTYLFS